MHAFHTLEHWIVAAIYIIGGFVVGFVFEKIVLAELRHIAKKTPWKGDNVIINSLRGMVIIWLLIGAAVVAGFLGEAIDAWAIVKSAWSPAPVDGR